MAAIAPDKLREKCERRLSGLDAARKPYERAWRNVAEYTQPLKGRWLSEGSRISQNTKMLMGVGRRASRTLRDGLQAGLTSPSRPWFKLTIADKDLARSAAVKLWLKDCQDALYRLFATTNFYSATRNGYNELGLYGAEAAFLAPHWKHGAVVHALSAGEFWLGIGDDGTPDSLYRDCPMTVAQVVSRFGAKCSPTARRLFDQGDYDAVVPVKHAVEPNAEREVDRFDATNMVYRSIYWEPSVDKVANGGGILAFEGFQHKPFWGARWDASGFDAYGGSPGIDAFGDLRQLQLQHLRKAQAVDFMVRPPMRAPINMETRAVNNVPGGVTFSAPSDKDGWGALYEVRPDVGALREDIAETEQQVAETFYEPLFKALLNVAEQREITALQASLMSDEKWTLIGPVIETVLVEKLQVAVDIAFSILANARALPPAPEELHGHEVVAEFTSVLAQLQRASELTGIERTVQFSSGLVAVDPTALDNIDVDETIRTYAEYQNVPPAMLRSSDGVDKLRAARQQQQQAAAAQAAAPAAKDGATAAQVLSQTKVGDGRRSLLDSVMGVS